MIAVSWREKDSFFILLPDTLAQQSQQYRHKAKSGQATIGRSWFKAPKKANAHNSTGYKFIQIRMQWFCEFAIPILAAAVAWYWHLVDDILDCSSSRDTVSKYEVAPVETCPDQCLRCDMFLLIHFASGVRNKKGTAAVLFWFC